MATQYVTNSGHFHSDGSTLVGNSINISGSAFFGGQIGNRLSQDDKTRILLESLAFDRMDSRLRNVAIALPDTCQWLQEHRHFHTWADPGRVEEHAGFLLLKGKPGSGKSTAMKTIIAWAQKIWSNQIILSYFFNAQAPDQLEKSSLGMYRTLVYQLLRACPQASSLFLARFASKLRESQMVEAWAQIELQNFLIELIESRVIHQWITIFVDALDENRDEDVRQMVSHLERLISQATSMELTVRACLATRHYPRITVRKSLSIELEQQVEHAQDIGHYIRTRLVTEDTPQSDALRREVQQRSASVFLWVVLVVSQLNKMLDQGKTVKHIRLKLDETPQSLHQVFTTIIAHEQDDVDECSALFRWTLFALRPLTPIELYVAVQSSCDVDFDANDLPSTPTLTKYLLNCSRGLVEVTRTEPVNIQFIHDTVRTFFTSRSNISASEPSQFNIAAGIIHFQPNQCHMLMAEECLQCLVHTRDSSSIDEEQSPIFQYAAEFWWQHVHAARQTCTPRLLTLAQKLLTDQGHLLAWLSHYDVDQGYYPKSGDHKEECPEDIEDVLKALEEYENKQREYNSFVDLASPLYYAASIGIPDIVQLQVDQGAQVNAHGGRLRTALHKAAYEGHVEVIRILLRHGVDINYQESYFGTPLQAAAYGGNLESVMLLIEHGAAIDVEIGAFGTALQTACALSTPLSTHAQRNQHVEIVEMLLKFGAAVNAGGGFHNSALQAASSHSLQLTKILLEHGAKVNVVGEIQNTPLQAASNRSSELVEILLKYGADVHSQGGIHHTPLLAASYRSFESVKMLLEHGADAHAEGGVYGTALKAAAAGHQLQVIEMLLRCGVDVNSRGGAFSAYMMLDPVKLVALGVCGQLRIQHIIELRDKCTSIAMCGKPDTFHATARGTALELVVLYGQVEAVELLLKHGADANTANYYLGTVLLAAIFSKRSESLKLLLDHGADVDTLGPIGTALQAASLFGLEECVKLLLERGAAVNSQGPFYTPLYAAAENGNVTIVEMLLAHGADVNLHAKCGSALQAASTCGHPRVVEVLLRHGADFRLESDELGALSMAALNGHDEVVKILVEHGANVNVDPHDLGALHTASWLGHSKIVEFLLERGADINIELSGRSPLYGASLNGHPKAVEVLLRHGADINTQGPDGTPLRVATLNGHQEVVALLQEHERRCIS